MFNYGASELHIDFILAPSLQQFSIKEILNAKVHWKSHICKNLTLFCQNKISLIWNVFHKYLLLCVMINGSPLFERRMVS